MAAKESDNPLMSGNYHFNRDTETYHYVKKTGFLVKSPSSAKIGRWRRRWCKLVDMVRSDPVTNTPTRNVQLEYYTGSQKNNGEPKMKGIVLWCSDGPTCWLLTIDCTELGGLIIQ